MRLVSLPVIALVLAVAAPALAAAASRYAGKVSGAGPISFVLRGSLVKQFRASVNVTCVSASGGKAESYLLVPGKSTKLDKHGRFTLQFKQAKRAGGPFPLYKINATVGGKVSGRSATGTVGVSYYKNQLVSGRLTLIACNSGKAKWTARRK